MADIWLDKISWWHICASFHGSVNELLKKFEFELYADDNGKWFLRFGYLCEKDRFLRFFLNKLENVKTDD